MTTNTEVANDMPMLEFLDSKKIPYVKIFLDKEAKKSGKALEQNIDVKIPSGWQKWSYDTAMTYNENADPKCNTINVNLKKAGVVIIDCDSKKSMEAMFKKYGNDNVSKSTGRGMPHIWFKKDAADGDTNSQSKLYDKVDVLYKNSFEDPNGYILNVTELSTFKDYKNKKTKKKVELKVKKEENKTPPPLKEDIEPKDREILDNIDVKYWEEYPSWRNLMWAIFNKYADYDLCLHYSRLARPSVDMKDIVECVEKDTKGVISIGTGYHYSKLSNEDKYFEIVGKYHDIDVESSDNAMAQLFLEHIHNNVVNHKGSFFVFNGMYWNKDDKKQNREYLKKYMHRTLSQIFRNKRIHVNSLAFVDDEDVMKKRNKSLSKICKMIELVDSESKQNNILAQVKMEIPYSDRKMDCIRTNYFCFKNCAFDLDNGKRVLPQREDYITMRTDYDYKEPTDKQKTTIINFMKSILPHEDVRESVISVLRRGMYGKQDEKFIFFNGGGRNGKDTLVDIFRCLITDVYSKVSHNAILTEKVRKGGPCSTTFSFDKKRAIIYSEPDEGVALNGAKIKELTGTEYICARELFSTDATIIMQAISIMLCNQLPEINARTDRSIIDRIVNLLFPVTFVDSENDIVDEFTVLKDTKFKEDSFRYEHRLALFDLLIKSEHRKVFEPESVKLRSQEYLYGSDELVCWLRKITELYKDDPFVSILDLHTMFKTDNFEEFNMEQKKTWKKRIYFMDKLTNLPMIKRFYKKRYKGNGVDKTHVLLQGWCEAVSPPLPPQNKIL